uniref:Uncharacterized protein n=1 Tax=Anopheles christyi TaxID=43041 RepID=A0A182KHZ8_9DIPT
MASLAASPSFDLSYKYVSDRLYSFRASSCFSSFRYLVPFSRSSLAWANISSCDIIDRSTSASKSVSVTVYSTVAFGGTPSSLFPCAPNAYCGFSSSRLVSSLWNFSKASSTPATTPTSLPSSRQNSTSRSSNTRPSWRPTRCTFTSPPAVGFFLLLPDLTMNRCMPPSDLGLRSSPFQPSISSSKLSVAFGGMFGGLPELPYAYSGAHFRMHFSFSFIDATPISNALMTEPVPRVNWNGSFLSRLESNFFPSASSVPV